MENWVAGVAVGVVISFLGLAFGLDAENAPDPRFQPACASNSGKFDEGAWLYTVNSHHLYKLDASCITEPKDKTKLEWLAGERLVIGQPF
jgi:hypothetical protein